MNDKEVAQRAIDVLNRVFEEDPAAIEALLQCRVSCNEALANDPTVQVRGNDKGYSVGLLGVINGICGTRSGGYGYVAAIYSTDCPVHGKVEETVGSKCPVDTCDEDVQLGNLEGFGVFKWQ